MFQVLTFCAFFFILFSVLVTVTGCVAFIFGCFFFFSTLILVLSEEANPKIFLVEYYFIFRVHCVSSAVHSSSSGCTALREKVSQAVRKPDR